MTHLRDLVAQMLDEPAPPKQQNTAMTVFLSDPLRYQLEALAEVTGQTKTRVASRLLAAAIVDAIEALPNESKVFHEPFPERGIGSRGEGFYTLRQLADVIAEDRAERAQKEVEREEKLSRRGYKRQPGGAWSKTLDSPDDLTDEDIEELRQVGQVVTPDQSGVK